MDLCGHVWKERTWNTKDTHLSPHRTKTFAMTDSGLGLPWTPYSAGVFNTILPRPGDLRYCNRTGVILPFHQDMVFGMSNHPLAHIFRRCSYEQGPARQADISMLSIDQHSYLCGVVD